MTGELADDIKRVRKFIAGLGPTAPPFRSYGRVTEILANVVKAYVEGANIGEECYIHSPHSNKFMRAEVIGLNGEDVILAPIGETTGLSVRSFVERTGETAKAPCGDALLGRVVDPLGQPLDGGDAIKDFADLHRDPPNSMSRPIISSPFITRIRLIDGFLTMGRGQRVGLFGAAGVGKSVLLGQIVRGAEADIVVVALIGERGREVAEFVEESLGAEGLEKSCVFVSTADRPPAERLRAAYAATAAAEFFRDQGKSVLLLIDSATRIARAIREIGLAAGELPVRRGFPPSTFTRLPKLLERAGNNEHGSITAIYTVLVEGDDDDADPVADELRSLLDGHIILSRELASKGQFPAIDSLRSKSRVMTAVVSKEHAAAAQTLQEQMAKLKELELLLQVGEYQPGGDPAADAAIYNRKNITSFLKQTPQEYSNFEETISGLRKLSGA